MKKKLICILCTLIILMFIGICFYGAVYYIQVNKSQKQNIKSQSSFKLIEESDFLTTNANLIQDRSGKEVLLHGVNLGGWLVQEYWMSPVTGDESVEKWTNLETLHILERRFGKEKTQKLMETYQENWISEEDIKNIASLGFNVIRIPFWYRNFYQDDKGTWITNDIDENPGFKKLDWVIEMAGKYGLYVILDMHGCPGGQSTDHCSASARECKLFSNSQYQDIMEELWVTIAKRYRNNPVVAAYDIMNEAEYYSGNVSDDPRNKVYDRMIKAIREVDDEHIIAVEAIWDLSVLPLPEEVGWENVVYEVHSYGDSDLDAYIGNIKNYSLLHNIPVYLGEFSDPSFWDLCKKNGIHHTSWSYKGNQEGDKIWFLLYQKAKIDADVINDSYLEILFKWSILSNSNTFFANDYLISEINKVWK